MKRTRLKKFLSPGFLCICVANLSLQAQVFPLKYYPKSYFRNPLEIPITLAGNFGELRPNHYHMGFDIKTEKRENLPVHAAADGYVSRIKIEPAGFGRAIYITHPNGYTTVYCHLNDFNPALENWVKQQQYAQQSWSIFMEVPANLFPVTKGDFIAWSGTTGGSQAPHVHFEIRSTADDVNHNPMLFGLPVSDNTQPVITRLAVYDRSISVYEQSPKIIPIKKTGAGYSSVAPVLKVSSPRVSLGISCHDTQSGSANQVGIFEADLFMDAQPVLGFQMDNISYTDTRALNAHIDYKLKSAGGPFIEHLSELPGYQHSIYMKKGGNGVLNLSDGEIHTVRIVVKDANNNETELLTNIQYVPVAALLPRSVDGKMFYPMMVDVFEGDGCEFSIGERCLYDSVHVAYRKTAAVNPVVVSAVHTIGNTGIPLADSISIRVQANAGLTSQQQSHTVMQRFAGSKSDVQKVQWQGNWATARFRDFGSFQLVIDNEAPEIIPIGFNQHSNVKGAAKLIFTVKDNLGEFKNFRAMLDGKWLRFTNDKGRSFIYKFDEHFLPGEHDLVITVDDEAGNTGTKSFHLSR